MKNYTITVNGNVYDVTVEEGTGSAAPAAKAAAPKAAPKAAAKAAAPAGAQGAVKVNAPMPGKILKVNATAGGHRTPVASTHNFKFFSSRRSEPKADGSAKEKPPFPGALKFDWCGVQDSNL